ncbi:response regulator transcription factor [Agrobacterium rubi]|uniref:winged helix-turn-helix domain-containing protein n=1 Tax=Agrobacterium rubi TaxID=28099 RepID=UPI0015737C0B|nr:response regulator transcription factor [Agrobacterium rubi]NTF23204.1 response regulator transcription factor [Agrobacterium rubi]NTF30124.1 response regulator transcription factor [Agrobacterium rubi]
MRHSLLIHTTDPELYLILRYILEEAGHGVGLASNLDGLLVTAPSFVAKGNTILLCLGSGDLLRAATLMRQHKPEFRIVGFPLDSKPVNEADLVHFDYVVKRPFDPSDLLNFLKLGAPFESEAENFKTMTFADVEIDLAAIRVRRGDVEINLSALHFRLLVHLGKHAGRVVSRDELIACCWPAGAIVEPRTVDIHVGRIRQALNTSGDNVIRTVRSIGYAAAIDDVHRVNCA